MRARQTLARFRGECSDEPRPRPDARVAAVVSTRRWLQEPSALTDPRLLVPLLMTVESLHYVFARLLLPLCPPVTSSLYMLAVAAVEVGFVARRRITVRAFLQHPVFFLAIGVLVALNTNMGFAAVRYVDPGTAALLNRTTLIFGVALGIVWLRERLSPTEVVGGIVALGGVAAVSFQPGDYFRLGSLIVIVAALFYALHSALVKRYGGAIGFADLVFFRLAATTAFLVLLAAAQGGLVVPGRSAWALLILAGTVNVAISRSLYYLALRRIDMTLLTIVSTMSPVATILWSMALFGSRPSLQEVGGGLAILAGVCTVSASRGGLLRWPR